jgi:hypothetical protein
MQKYNHVYYLGFTLNSDEPDPAKISPDALHEAITKRINSGGLLEVEHGESINITEEINTEDNQ